MHRLTSLARELRKNQTNAETILWVYIRNKQIANTKFRRQMPIGKYIADFVCREHKLIIELDGGHHNEDNIKKYDEERTKCFKNLGYNVIRIWNNDVLTNLEGVLEAIYTNIKVSPHPSPLRPEREQNENK